MFYKVVQTFHGVDKVVAQHLDVESASCQAEARHINSNAGRTRVVGPNGRLASASDGRAWEWVRK